MCFSFSLSVDAQGYKLEESNRTATMWLISGISIEISLTRSHVIAYAWGSASSPRTNKSEIKSPAVRFKWQVVGGRCERKEYPLKDRKSDSGTAFPVRGSTYTPSTAERAQVGRNLFQH